MGLPSFQSEITVVPNMYSLMVEGVTRASHTFCAGAAMVMEERAIRSVAFPGIGVLPPSVITE
jgi:hypothetical protein